MLHTSRCLFRVKRVPAWDHSDVSTRLDLVIHEARHQICTCLEFYLPITQSELLDYFKNRTPP